MVGRAGPPRRERAPERAAVRAGAPHRRDPAAGADRRASCPSVAGLELAALYQPAAGSQVGGDFYSAWPLADGRLALLVGDVSGKGVEAAGVTAMVRYMAEALSQHRADPAELVGELNDLLCPRMPDGSLVTLVLAVIDTGARRAALVRRRATRRRSSLGARRRATGASTTPTRPAASSPASVFRDGRRAASAPATCWSSTPTGSSRRAGAGASSARRRLRDVLVRRPRESPPGARPVGLRGGARLVRGAPRRRRRDRRGQAGRGSGGGGPGSAAHRRVLPTGASLRPVRPGAALRGSRPAPPRGSGCGPGAWPPGRSG